MGGYGQFDSKMGSPNYRVSMSNVPIEPSRDNGIAKFPMTALGVCDYYFGVRGCIDRIVKQYYIFVSMHQFSQLHHTWHYQEVQPELQREIRVLCYRSNINLTYTHWF